MAFGEGGAGGGPISDINVTPLVDVMLVLLVIFMVTAPIIQSGVAVDLPAAETGHLDREADDLVVSIDASGDLFLGEEGLDEVTLLDRLAVVAEATADQRVYVRADAGVDYGRVMTALDLIRRAGLHRVGLVTRPPDAERE